MAERAESHGALHYQDLEVQLLVELLGQLESRVVVDAGAERGEFSAALLDAGATSVYAIEPHPGNAAYLRERFAGEARLCVLELAVGDSDSKATLHVARDKTGKAEHSYHSLIECAPTETIEWVADVEVMCRTLDRLAAEGAVASEIGILKIDTERADFGVIRGLGHLAPRVIMFEFWDGLEETVGEPLYQPQDILDYLAPRGYGDFALIKRRESFQTVQLNDGATTPGEWGNVIALHNDVVDMLLPTLTRAASLTQQALVSNASELLSEATARLKVIDELSSRIESLQVAADQRLRLVEEQQSSISESMGVVMRLQEHVIALEEVIARQGKALQDASAEIDRLRAAQPSSREQS